jgi:acyl-homoserine lactone acylase PvdQ
MIEGGSWGYWDIDRFLVMTRFLEHWGQKLGRKKCIELFGNPGEGKVLPHQIPISPDYGHFAQADPHQEPIEGTAHTPDPDATGALAMHGLFSTFLDTLTDMPHESRKLADLDFVGSNSWVVHGSRTTSGKPLSCSDSHENFDLPNIYYETHVVDASTGHNFYGYVVAGGGGIPVYGTTQYLSYGMAPGQWHPAL